MRKPTIQLSLAISGREEEAKRDAAAMQAKLEAAGYRVYNPFELVDDIEPKNLEEHVYWWACTVRCCDNIIEHKPDAIVSYFRGYKDSHGMRIEDDVAQRAGYQNIYPFGPPGIHTGILMKLGNASLPQSCIAELEKILRPFDAEGSNA